MVFPLVSYIFSLLFLHFLQDPLLDHQTFFFFPYSLIHPQILKETVPLL